MGGLFAYDIVANFEPLGDAKQANQCPDFVFYVAESLLVVDHQKESCDLQTTLFNHDDAELARIRGRITEISQQCENLKMVPAATKVEGIQEDVSISDEDFCQIVRDLKEYVVRGDIFQVVPSRRFTLPCPSPLAAYKELKQSNPSPYMFYMQDELFTLFGASPESALKYGKDSNQIEIYLSRVLAVAARTLMAASTKTLTAASS
ncbi:anthranilate synthase aminase component [Vibrio maritimus]|uniref:anthranilate synthase n=1 Tax=Vibrio maritimus TaxID=990268 RepID=A0A090RTL6_9VIBR|nr:anthranilate synthase aminase component [Vibrio maritimus]